MRKFERVLFPAYVDVEPFDPCNLRCAFCFGPDFLTLGNKWRPPSVWRNLFGDLVERGVEGIVVSGGEPTLYRGREDGVQYNIATLLEAAKEHGLRTTMSTNATRPKILRLAAPYLDWIALPLDAVSPESQQRMRGFVISPDQMNALIADLRESNPDLKVKLGTVATAWNRADILELALVLADGRIAIDTWKIYQFAARRMAVARGHADSLQLMDDEMLALRSEVERTWGGRAVTFRTTWSTLDDRSGAYLFVYSSGEVVIPNLLQDAADHVVGNVFAGGSEVLDRVVPDIVRLQHDGLLRVGNNDKNYRDTYVTRSAT